MKTLKDHNFFGTDATMVAHSTNQFNTPVATMVVTFPRYILAELNTHRMFSRNSASSRAIPFNKVVERVKENPFIPIAWQKDHKGMQGTEYHTVEAWMMDRRWLKARDEAVNYASSLNYIGATKQLANRLLEPFMWHTAIITSTEWENFFNLRCPQYSLPVADYGTYRSWKDLTKDINYPEVKEANTLFKLKNNKGQADIHIMELAEQMWDCMNESTPKLLNEGEWHIPFSDEIDETKISSIAMTYTIPLNYIKRMVSVATCARISFGNISPATSDYAKDINLYQNLLDHGHMSPFEHVAQCMSESYFESFLRGTVQWTTSYDNKNLILVDDYEEENNLADNPVMGWCNNFRGWIQERWFLENKH